MLYQKLGKVLPKIEKPPFPNETLISGPHDPVWVMGTRNRGFGRKIDVFQFSVISIQVKSPVATLLW